MDFITILLATVSINIIIYALLIRYLGNRIVELFKTQDEYNEMFEKYISEILDIINYNGLVRKPKVKEETK